MNSKGEVIEKVADYIGVESFAKVIESLYRECLENFDDADDLEEYIADLYGKNIQSLAWEFTHKVNREMKKYLHLNDQRMDGNFANLYNDYPRHVTGTFWATDYDGDDYYDLYPQMVARLDAAEDSEQASKDRDGKKKKTYKHTCKGNPYIRLQNENIFVADLERKVYKPLRDLANKMATVEDHKDLYDAVRKFNKNRKHLAWDTKQADAFIHAYKGSGSYYTMRNLIMFHGARFMKNGRKMSEANSLKELESKAKLYDEEGWKMLGVLKQLIKDNNISVQGKILEWKKAKSENK